MHVTVERLRLGLLVGALLLVAVIASFLGYARLRAHRFLKDLPGRMGAELRQETNGFTYSQTVQGRTVFTIHAAKAIQRKDGKVTLHDVGIVLYGRTQAGVTKAAAAKAGPTGGARDLADRIYGKEFEYDQAAGVVRATGEVHIDLEAPIPVESKAKMDFAAGVEAQHDPRVAPEDDRVIHVKTSGLVFLQKLGVASTQGEIEFAYRGLRGQAQGADYNTDNGVLVLQSAVTVTGLREGRPAVLRASRAEMNRLTNRVRLTEARYSSSVAGSSSGESGQETASADEVTFFGAEGTTGVAGERLEAHGSVVLTEGSSTIAGAGGEMLLDGTNRPRSATLGGGVEFRSEEATRTLHGTAAEGRGQINAEGRLEQVLMTGSVAVHEAEKAAGADGRASDRNLTSGRLQLALGSAPGGRQWLKEAVADGDARLQSVTAAGVAVAGGKGPVAGKSGVGAESSELRADHLRAQLQLVNGTGQLTRVDGMGHTEVRRVGLKGEDTSLGNSLEATFRGGEGKTGRGGEAKTGRGGEAKAGARGEIASAVQVGDVAITHVDAGTGAMPEHATAARAVYEGDEERVTLTGGVRLTDGGSVLLADRVSMLQGTGDATATGSVRASYLQAGTAAGGTPTGEPVHVLAERAEMEHGTGKATFYGGEGTGGAAGSRLARLWQGGSQVEAPVIELGQTERTLRAHGVGGGAKGSVRTVLTSGGGVRSGNARPAVPGGGGAESAGQVPAPATAGKGEVIRVASRELVYSDAERRAEFTGGVVLLDAQGTMRSERAEVFLEPADATGRGSKGASGGVGAGAGAAARGAGNKTANALGTTGLMGGAVERIVASGGVEIEQPTRRGRGEQVVYTAADGFFVMTGTPAVPPRVVDQAHGTVVGQLLRFNTGDNSVVVSGDAGQSVGSRNGDGNRNRVRTETRVRQAR